MSPALVSGFRIRAVELAGYLNLFFAAVFLNLLFAIPVYLEIVSPGSTNDDQYYIAMAFLVAGLPDYFLFAVITGFALLTVLSLFACNRVFRLRAGLWFAIATVIFLVLFNFEAPHNQGYLGPDLLEHGLEFATTLPLLVLPFYWAVRFLSPLILNRETG